MNTKKTPIRKKVPLKKVSVPQSDTLKQKADLLGKMMAKMSPDIFESLCSEGRGLVIEAAKLTNTDVKKFADQYEMCMNIENAYFTIDSIFSEDDVCDNDFSVEVIITHIPSKKVIKDSPSFYVS